MNAQWVQYSGKSLRPYDQSWASVVVLNPFSPSYLPSRTRRWPDPQGFIVNVNFWSSSVIVNAPGLGPTPLVECARQVAASALTISLRGNWLIFSTSRFQPRSLP